MWIASDLQTCFKPGSCWQLVGCLEDVALSLLGRRLVGTIRFLLSSFLASLCSADHLVVTSTRMATAYRVRWLGSRTEGRHTVSQAHCLRCPTSSRMLGNLAHGTCNIKPIQLCCSAGGAICGSPRYDFLIQPLASIPLWPAVSIFNRAKPARPKQNLWLRPLLSWNPCRKSFSPLVRHILGNCLDT